MNNFEWCVYTYKHRKAFWYLTEKLIADEKLRGRMLLRAKVHDMDKMVMYLYLDQITSQKIHVRTQPHHLESGLGESYEDFLETVIDYESAPYTKPDKPLNAYDFVKELLSMKLVRKEQAEKLFSIMHELGIDSSYSFHDSEWENYIKDMGEVTEEMIQTEVMEYVQALLE